MSAWVRLLVAVLAAGLRVAAAQGDPLPAALVELVRKSPIASIEDLQLLLLSDSVDDEEGNSAVNGGHRLPRSLDAQPAQQALCKVRTEVVEVTRAMLDRSNANFLLWPPCVEVQRCSGCCNTKSLQCVPVVTHTRHLQVMKIEYINKRPIYAKAVVSVVDHVECRCQQAPRPPVLKRKSPRRQHNHGKDLHRNHTLSQGHDQVKGHAKDELHQWDVLKQNQGTGLEDLMEHHWSSRGDTFTQHGEGYNLAGEDAALSRETLLSGSHWAQNSTGAFGAKGQIENREWLEKKNDWISGGFKVPSTVDDSKGGEGLLLLNSTGRRVNESHHEGRSNFSKAAGGRFGSRFRPTKEPNPDPREPGWRGGNDTPEEERILQIAEEKLEQERKEMLLLQKRLDEEEELLRSQQRRRGEEERERESLNLLRRNHQQTAPTQKPETESQTTTQRPVAPAGHKPPPRHRRRMRKNRKRISKAAMRAMLM